MVKTSDFESENSGSNPDEAASKPLDDNVPRDAEGIPCDCGGYADRDYNMTVQELAEWNCGDCCGRAFVCRLCKTRWVGSAEAPEMQ